jgi:hypothetical protein
MIKKLDMALKRLLEDKAEPDSDLAGAKISFALPDEEWRGKGQELELNMYLYDIREDRKLRSNERRVRRDQDGIVDLMEPLPRVSCAYVITAWNKSGVTNNEDREYQEHRLLSQVLRVLLKYSKLPEDYWVASQSGEEPPLPMVSAQAGGLVEPGEFWSALNTAVRPSIHCIVTLTLDSQDWQSAGPMVVTQIMAYEQKNKPGTRRQVARIGGRVTDRSSARLSVPGVEVSIPDLGKTAMTDSNGYYTIRGIHIDNMEGSVLLSFYCSSTGTYSRRFRRRVPASPPYYYNFKVWLNINVRLVDKTDPSLVITGAAVTLKESPTLVAVIKSGYYLFPKLTAGGDYTVVVQDYDGDTYSYKGLEHKVSIPTADGLNTFTIQLARK